ncbi:MAG: serine protease, partial [Atopobiaceae bacterium]|nr:serine protease [Atopobiaceae bacterium]
MNDLDDWRGAVARVTDAHDGFSSCWLASDVGHIITVGHLFGEDNVLFDRKEDADADWANGLKVQFPGSSPVPATLLRARVDRGKYLDYAVLKIDASAIPHGVRPIPISTSIPDVRNIKMYGFGIDKPDTRMAAVGRLEGWSEGLSGESWLKVTCEDAVQNGYSGAAVYSEMAQGAVALQIEASDKGLNGDLSNGVSNVRTVVAVAMVRIMQDWPALEKIVTRSTEHVSRVYSNGFVLSHSHGIVGRQDQVDAILKMLDKGQAVLVYGEGGIGKTEVCR